MYKCAACGEFTRSSSYQKHGIWAGLFSTEKKEALKTDRHSNTGSIYNPPLTSIWSLVLPQEMTHRQQYKVSWGRLLVGEQEQCDLFLTALLS